MNRKTKNNKTKFTQNESDVKDKKIKTTSEGTIVYFYGIIFYEDI